MTNLSSSKDLWLKKYNIWKNDEIIKKQIFFKSHNDVREVKYQTTVVTYFLTKNFF